MHHLLHNTKSTFAKIAKIAPAPTATMFTYTFESVLLQSRKKKKRLTGVIPLVFAVLVGFTIGSFSKSMQYITNYGPTDHTINTTQLSPSITSHTQHTGPNTKEWPN